MNKEVYSELSVLLEGMCEHRLTARETARLEELVLSNSDAKWLYLSYVDLHGSLYWDAAGAGSATALLSTETGTVGWLSANESTIRKPEPIGKQQRPRFVGAISIAACLFFAMLAWFGGERPEDPPAVVLHPSENGNVEQLDPIESGANRGLEVGSRINRQPVELVNIPSSLVGEEQTPAVERTAVVPAPPEPLREQLDSREVVAAINGEIRRGWINADVQPSSVADDAEWLRRVSLDLIGRIPTVAEAEAFLADSSSGKREKVIDRLLDDSGFSRNLTTMWANLLIGRRTARQVDRPALQKFLRMAFAANRPWNQVVYDLVAAEGSSSDNGATNFLIAHLNNDALPATAVTARVFLGQQVQCNQCHNNPFNKTQQTAFWELHSFFSQTASVPRYLRDARTGRENFSHMELVTRDAGGPIFYETQNGLMRVAYPRFNGREVDAGPETNRRAVLARLMTEGDQPQLAAAFVNRMWSHFFGEAFTPAVDDIGPHSPASHPELLSLLARQFVRSGYDTKQLVRWICNSEAYQLTSRVAEGNRVDDPVEGQLPHFSRMYVKSMTAEQIYDSFLVATRAHRAGGVDWTQAESQRQQWLSQFVVNFETDENDEAMSFDGTMSQALTLMNGPLVEKALEISPGTLLDEVVRKRVDDKEKIQQLCLATLSRLPSSNEFAAMRKMVRGDSTGRGPRGTGRPAANAEGYQDLLWALLNSNEFSVVH